MELIISLIILIFSAIIHEVAHGFVADKLGDPTARLLGRLTLNPKSHIDPIGSIFLPLILIIQSFYTGTGLIFGWAKPIPIDPFNLKEGKKDIALVALSGPLVNIVIALISSIIIRLISAVTIVNPTLGLILMILIFFLKLVIYLNLLLAVFNLLPIPPLDGSKVFAQFLPEDKANAYLSIGQFGIFILFFLLMFPIGNFSLGSLLFQLINFSQSLLLP